MVLDQSCSHLHVFVSGLTYLNALCFKEGMQTALLQDDTRLLGFRNQSLQPPVHRVTHSPCMNGQL